MEIEVNQKDDLVMKILHYFITKEDYKPIILKGANNEIWLENFDKDIELIRINTKYLHNKEQLRKDLFRTNLIRKDISKKTLSFNTHVLNILIDTSDNVTTCENKNIYTAIVKGIEDIKNSKLINTFFPSIEKDIYSNEGDALEFFKITDELNKKTQIDEKKMDKIFKPKKPTTTFVLIAINVIVFILMQVPRLYNIFIAYGANNPSLIKFQGFIGLYRLITSAFMHSDIFHLTINMYSLYLVGEKVETYYGKKKFLLIYIISAIVGSAFSNVFLSLKGISIGASGAIFGIFGALAYFSYNYRSTIGNFFRSSIIPTIIINLILGFTIPNIDIYGHLGGLFAGVLISMSLGCPGKRKNKVSIINSIITLSLLTTFMIYMIFNR